MPDALVLGLNNRTSWLRRLGLSLLLGAALVFAAGAAGAQSTGDAPKTFTLGGRAQITLATDWTPRTEIEPPPPPLLAPSAPRMAFTDILVLENRKAPAVLEIGFSENPFFGSDATNLDVRMHARLTTDLFNFFFPPPRSCLARAKAALEEARRKQEEERHRKEAEQKDKKTFIPLEPISVAQECDFSPMPLDFFASQLSPRVVFGSSTQGERVTGQLRDFYLPPMELIEINGNSFFLFEARAERTLEFSETQRFGLEDDLRGARAHFFWAVGARNPFPFLRDPQRKDVQLFHVAYACLGFNGGCGEEFRRLLASISFAP